MSTAPTHPYDPMLREGRIPHIWCPGCGIGTVVTSFAEALKKNKEDMNKVVIVSGIGCASRLSRRFGRPPPGHHLQNSDSSRRPG